MLFRNPQARRAAYPEALKAVLSIERAAESRQWLSTWNGLSREPTPLCQLHDIAEAIGVGSLSIKDESKRGYLQSFKALGAPVALVRLAQRLFPDSDLSAQDLFAGKYATLLQKSNLTVISATDGNHGRALAAAARSIGCRCVIVIHQNVSNERRAAIEQLDAEVIRISGNYDESVMETQRLSDKHGWYVVSDTSYHGYEVVPRDVMQGYGAIAAEIIEQQEDDAGNLGFYSHMLIQGGVGGLAAGVISYFAEYFGVKRPIFIIVEPEQADCLYQSALSGAAGHTRGTVDSIMAGLACGSTSPLAWRFLVTAVDFFLTISDASAVAAMRILANGSVRDIPIVAGESGAAGLAGLLELADNPEFRKAVGLCADSRVLLINTEGDTAPHLYETLVGQPATEILSIQRARCSSAIPPSIFNE
jgi:diaminopropionate ammonia-lyase